MQILISSRAAPPLQPPSPALRLLPLKKFGSKSLNYH